MKPTVAGHYVGALEQARSRRLHRCALGTKVTCSAATASTARWTASTAEETIPPANAGHSRQGRGVCDNNLIAAANCAGVANIIYVSIVGIDRIPPPYDKAKLRVEEALAASQVGRTIIREQLTQFHSPIQTTFAIRSDSPAPALIAIKGARFLN